MIFIGKLGIFVGKQENPNSSGVFRAGDIYFKAPSDCFRSHLSGLFLGGVWTLRDTRCQDSPGTFVFGLASHKRTTSSWGVITGF